MVSIVIGDQGSGNKHLSTVDFMKRELANLHATTNANMNKWIILADGTRVHLRLINGRPQAFIYTSIRELFCAIGNPFLFSIPTNPNAFVSKDGIDWSCVQLSDMPTPALTPSGWGIGAFNGDIIVSVRFNSNSGEISDDRGFTWTPIVLPKTAYWSDIVWNGSFFCMISLEDSNTPLVTAYSAVSSDGITWETGLLPSNGASSPTTSSWTQLSWNGSFFCAISPSLFGSARSAISEDGLNWIVTDSIPHRFWSGLDWNGSVFCAVASNDPLSSYVNDKVATSPDGIAWTLRDIPTSVDSWSSLVWGGSVFCAVASNQVLLGVIRTMTSPDGIEWSLSTDSSLSPKNWFSVAWSGKRFYAVTSLGSLSTIAATSLDGLAWVELEFPPCAVSSGVISVPTTVSLLPPTNVG